MFERISNSFALARSSWQVLRTDKQLVVFPIISGICCLLVTLAFFIPLAMIQNVFQDLFENKQWLLYVLLFVYYFVNYFIIVFFNSALTACALMRFNGEEPTLGDGLTAAAVRLPQILAWALVSATVGILLRAIENAHEKAGYFISAILGTVWSVITYFVIPVLVIEKVGPFAAIKRSTAILKKTWGEALVGHFGIGFFLFLLAIPGILIIVLGVALLASGALFAVGIAVLILGLLYFLGLAAVSAALQGIFVSALYEYAAHGRVPNGFDQSTMAGAFTHKPA